MPTVGKPAARIIDLGLFKMPEMAIAVGCGSLVGLVLGLTGAGGSVLAVPLLMWGLHWPLQQAAPVSLVAVSAAAAAGTYWGWDVKLVRYKAATLIAVAGTLVSPLGFHAASILPNHVLELMFAGVLLFVAVRMLLRLRKAAGAAADAGNDAAFCRLGPETGRFMWTRPCAAAVTVGGGVTGFLSGLLGVGGGFVIVPVLRAVTDLSMHSAVATSLMAVALTSAGAVGVAVFRGIHLPWLVALPFVAGALIGMLAGRKVAPKLSASLLQRGFAMLTIAVALGMTYGALR